MATRSHSSATPATSRSAGAGDTFVAALALALAAGASTAAAAELASAAAAIVVGKDGTAACSSQELREYLSGEGKHITDRQRLADRCEFYRPGPQVCAVPAQVRRQTCSYYKG
ncbi:MAG TPA: PfkB family carbohydrate kinase [Gemmataceae bacterium]|nr:PfkB family carbohydrate kinase [Gemmataceae bacterium]